MALFADQRLGVGQKGRGAGLQIQTIIPIRVCGVWGLKLKILLLGKQLLLMEEVKVLLFLKWMQRVARIKLGWVLVGAQKVLRELRLLNVKILLVLNVLREKHLCLCLSLRL